MSDLKVLKQQFGPAHWGRCRVCNHEVCSTVPFEQIPPEERICVPCRDKLSRSEADRSRSARARAD
jgi:hypothetical protein